MSDAKGHEWEVSIHATRAVCTRCGTEVVAVLDIKHHGHSDPHPRASTHKRDPRAYAACRPAKGDEQ